MKTAKKSKFKIGDRVWFTHAGEVFKQEGFRHAAYGSRLCAGTCYR